MEGPLSGRAVGPHRLGRLLGQGASGAVYEARDGGTGRRVAVKVFHIDPQDPRADELTSRFFAEARAVNLIGHPGLVEVLDVDRAEDGTRFLVMEYVEGETLAGRLLELGRAGTWPPPLPWSLSVLREIAAVLQVVHGRRITHRDLKPENVMLLRGEAGAERVKLLDFGIAQFLDADERLTTEGRALGTPYYMAPEQCAGAERLDEKVDSYALGVLLFELASGRVPYDGPPHAILLKHLHAPVPRLREAAPHVPAWLDELAFEMMSKAPITRPVMEQIVRRLQGP